jgi:hypothetical protein
MLLVLLGCVQVIELKDPAPEGTIAEACAGGSPDTVSLDVSFPARAPGCAWGEDGNREPEQGFVTARAEESVALDLDGGICSLAFDFTESDDGDDDDELLLRYDDGFLLAFGGAILVASYAPLVEVFETDGFLRLYDWSRLVDAPFGFEEEGTYCLGEAEGLSSCEVPPPETPGPLALAFGEPVVGALAERAHAEDRYAFDLVTYGDNDPDVDCSHSALSFRVEVTAVPY